MKTIGVITHWGSLDNYGQTLQTYALQQTLSELNLAPFLIRYKEDGIKRSFLQKLFSCLNPRFFYSAIRNKRLNRIDYRNNIQHGRDLRSFLDSKIRQADIIYGREDLLASPPDADIFITGSDQVWNKLDRSYFLDFTDKKKIAYAASFGSADYVGKALIDLNMLLKQFSHITVRENSGVDICRRANVKNASVVPDPTLLLTDSHYRNLAVIEKNIRPYILIYFLGNQTDFNIERCYEFAEENNLDVKYIAGQRQIDKYEKIYPSMEEWLGLIDKASYVVTNSFHGTALSIILNTPFISVPLTANSKKMNDRLETLLTRYNLVDRITSDLSVLRDPIEYQPINQIIAEDRDFGRKNLIQMIER